MEEKILKRWLKRKVKISEALLVGFLITGGIMYGQDLGETNDRDITVEYTFNHKPTEDEENEIAAAQPVLPSGVNSFTNNGIIRGYTSITGETSKVNVRNTSLIKIYGYAYGYGKTTGSGNGIGSYGDNSSNIGDMTNSGIVRGYAETRGGDAVTNTVGNMIGPGSNYYYGSAYAYAEASGEAIGSGNGVGSYSDNGNSGIGTIINSGTIYGYAQVKGGTATTKGWSVSSGEAFSYAQGKTTGSGNGVGSYSGNDSSNIGTITNSGIISGNIDIDRGTAKAEASGDNLYTSDTTTDVSIEALGSGNGISSYNNNDVHSDNDSSIGDIINSGTIGGYAKVGREVSEPIEK